MREYQSTITQKGQITIPYYIRNKLHLSSGNKVEFIVQDNCFIAIPINKSIKNLKGILPRPLKPLNIEQMNDIIKGSYDRN